MKKIMKFITILLLILLIMNPLNVHALTKQTSYIGINNNQKFEINYLSFSNISFNTTNNEFGLNSTVFNNSNKTINYIYTIYYYDLNKNLIAKISNSGIANPGKNIFNEMSNFNILNNHKSNEIYYYILKIDTGYNNTSLTPSENDQYSSYDYVIDKYDVNIIVNENNTLDITETITAYFNTYKHGIIRSIPLKNKITRLDGTTSVNHAQITNLNVNNKYVTYKEKGVYKIKIGSTNNSFKGEKKYIIKYNYNLGKDPMKKYDELYYNIIGNNWDTVIGNITFSITMPKEFDSSKLGFSSGSKGSTNNKNVKYNINKNKITGNYNGILNKQEGLTIRCELPDGYFVNAGLKFNFKDYYICLLLILFLCISVLLWYLFGKDDEILETVELSPPSDFNSLEIGFLYKGEANSKDVTSLLIYLANKGYLKIAETNLINSYYKDFKITKLKKYDGNNINEKIFLDELFYIKDEVTSEDLYKKFYKTTNKILSNINIKENKNKIFEKFTPIINLIIIVMIIITFLCMTIPPTKFVNDQVNTISAFFGPGVGLGLILYTLVDNNKNITGNKKQLFIYNAIPIIFLSIITLILMPQTIWPFLRNDISYIITYIVGIFCMIGMAICLKYMPKRTTYGKKMLTKIKGFKNYLETVEKDKLETLVMQDPEYFYNILPYAYVLGVSDIWINKFETISLEPPSWLDNSTTFDISSFDTFMNTTIDYIQTSISSSPTDSSNDSSGGGSSGDGSGGGGGSSW